MTTQTLKNWHKVRLEEIADFQYGYTASSKETDTGTKLLRITDIVPDLIDWETVPFCDIDEKEIKQYEIKKGDILIARTGATAGYAKLIRKQPQKSVFASYLIRLTMKKADADPDYVGRIIESDIFKQFVTTHAGGAAQPHANAPVLKNFELSLPDIKTQTEIVDMLSGYDDLIENNTHRIKILEQTAQAIYTEWFMRFRFPGHEKVKMVDSGTDFGKIPEGWEVKKIREVGKIVTGKTPPTSDASNFGDFMPFIKTPDMHSSIFCISTNEKLSVQGVETQKNKIIPRDAIVVSCIGTIGVVGITTRDSQTNQQINSIIPTQTNIREYLYFVCVNLKSHLKNIGANGATMGNVNKEKFETIEILSPSNSILNLFNDMTQEMFDEIKSLSYQNQNLRQTRDLLLPKLVTGEIQV